MNGPTRLATLALLAATMLTPALAGAAGWSPTATKSVDPASIAGGSDLGALPSSQALTIRVGMQMRNQAALVSAVAAQADPQSASYGKFLTPKTFAAYYAPSAAQISSVVNYLSAAGFTNIVVEPNGLLISADGTAAMAESAFNTSLEQVLVGGKTLFVNTTAVQIPTSLAPSVLGVLGLNTVGHMASQIALPTPPTLIASYTPQQFRKIYSATKVPFALKASIAIMAEGDMTGVISDLRTAEAAFSLPQVPVTVVQVGLPSPDVSGADEWDLDTQTSSGIAGNLKNLYIYTTTSLSDSDLALEFSHWVHRQQGEGGQRLARRVRGVPIHRRLHGDRRRDLPGGQRRRARASSPRPVTPARSVRSARPGSTASPPVARWSATRPPAPTSSASAAPRW